MAIHPSALNPAYGPAQVYNCKAYDTSLPPNICQKLEIEHQYIKNKIFY